MARLFIAALCGMALASTANPPADAATATSVAAYQVRLRKLHLVRPDLIPYPVYYEVLC
jgi:hypothetical protein